ncbi:MULTISPECIES: 16S rRNA (uracil(1498)-N(3))-methyltransferase [unclassified Polaromonas]|uniref:16S rRNA (uracil(1498)-N(3))-methyltransferase n=1 Tax=unclassified Polaromonas TaxID=2638319 RepID=UPI000BDC61FC|nr:MULTISPECIES: 16S rRNA (uracil(1498)-N(3))-methyltransferase [unclassified Polaromonas]OYY32939.1 MAG: 16S rRNA (uracil(1498)-N(3))-methyltransferase [Polaromonas sp. 35-63-35]OYZ16334.1 MAG: 16S rRNA (uracil(1498)-N(3))-methyltransferase [Polaromonas sp. 16-63-31]OYZ76377.1 MAG: 16S rRNA (uracil(1498)-N(3))-methyltransferase [Polaromonas sp. 24-63-21]OZA48964.1 MAG: 16S rRNA (uracil(1498)-N(3))-methyltransferase [Polaromonas sp. 17-63-33]OZA85595.1 MAG: 16S rRNA (uracil(1498)-N(3))-methylt
MTARFYADLPLASGDALALPERAARHVQVLRLQPGDVITLFNSQGGEFQATIERMGRSDVQVKVDTHSDVERETRRAVHLAVGMPANERMDWLVEKASELGAASITPLMAERSVLRLKGERADKKVAHWQGVAIAACEQCGRNRLPPVHAVDTLSDWLAALPPVASAEPRLLLSLRAGTQPLAQALAAYDSTTPVTLLSGPEGGLSTAEEDTALARGFLPVTLGPRVLRAETAPLACLALLTLEN